MYWSKALSNDTPFSKFLLKHGFVRKSYDNCVYILKRNYEAIIYLLLHGDDIFIYNSRKKEIRSMRLWMYNLRIMVLAKIRRS